MNQATFNTAANQNAPSSLITILLSICPAYVSPAQLRKHKQAGPSVQVTARKLPGGKWEGIFRDTTGRGVEIAGHASETDAVKAAAFYINRAAG